MIISSTLMYLMMTGNGFSWKVALIRLKKKRTPGATSPTMASFDVRWDDIYGALRVFISAAESKKLLTKQSTEDYVYCYDVVWDIDGNKTALCYGKVFVKAGVTI